MLSFAILTLHVCTDCLVEVNFSDVFLFSAYLHVDKEQVSFFLFFFTFKSMIEDMLQDGNKVDELWR